MKQIKQPKFTSKENKKEQAMDKMKVLKEMPKESMETRIGKMMMKKATKMKKQG